MIGIISLCLAINLLVVVLSLAKNLMLVGLKYVRRINRFLNIGIL